MGLSRVSIVRVVRMHWDRSGNWKSLTGKMRETWGRWTHDDAAVLGGQRDQLIGNIQRSLGIAKDAAEAQLRDLETVFDR